MKKTMINITSLVAGFTLVTGLLLGFSTSVVAQPEAVSMPYNANAVAVTVNGEKITEGDVDKALKAPLGNRPVDEAMMGKLRAQYRDQALQSLIMQALLTQKANEMAITVQAGEVAKKVRAEMDAYCKEQGISKEEMAKNIQAKTGMGIDEFIISRAKTPELNQAMLHEKVMKAQFPKEPTVTDAEIQAFYKENLKTRFQKPARVKASHILFKLDPGASADEKAKVKKEAEKVLAQARKKGADFSKLAAEHSSCPSSAQGGDLGFFTKDAMVKPFADAAFAMKKGEITGPVETRFGYHIILVTDNEPAETVAFAEAKDQIKKAMIQQKTAEQYREFLDELEKKATIVYPAKAPA